MTESTRPDPLRVAARAFVAAAFALVRARAQPAPPVDDSRWDWVRVAPDRFRFQALARQWWQEPLGELHGYGKLERLPEYAEFVELLQKDPAIGHLLGKMIGADTTSHRLELPQVVAGLVWRAARGTGEGELDIENFDRGYSAWRSELTTKTIHQIWVAPLLGLKAPARPIALTPEVVIAPLDDNEISRLLLLRMLRSDDVSPFDGPTVQIPAGMHGLRIAYTTERLVADDLPTTGRSSPWRANNDLFEDVLIALSLFKGGRVASSGMAILHTTWPLEGSTSFGPLADLAPPIQRPRLDYALNEEEAVEFQTFFHDYVNAKHAIGFASRRFAYASERIRAEDRIIDLVIAAESLFLGKQEGELSYRLAMRAAHFLQPDCPSRAATFAFIRNAYDVRSKIAHGTRPKPDKLALIDGTPCKGPAGFADELERVVRVALRKAIALTADKGSFMREKDWEALIFDEEQPHATRRAPQL